MTVTITPKLLAGSITPPPSKSQAHRCLIAAALAGQGSVVRNLADSQDIEATRRCMSALESGEDMPLLDCGESGSTLRFLIPVALALRGGARFTGHGRLMERPQKPYFDLFAEKGIFCEQKDNVLTVRGRLEPGIYSLPGNVSSQFVTGLLYALPLLDGDSEIRLTTPLESVGYVSMTLQALEAFGVRAGWKKGGGCRTLLVPGAQRYVPAEVTVEADWSQAGFWYAAQGIGSDVTVTGMNPNSIQGDRIILDWGRMIRGEPLSGGVTVPVLGRARPGETRKQPQTPRGCSVSIDVSHSPDLVPPLAAWGALMEGTLYLKNAARLRMKESDRLSAVREELCKLGARVEEGPDSLTITGVDHLTGGVTDAHNDHRIAMMLAIAATRADGPVTITGAESVRKSYPTFWADYVRLGGCIVKEEEG